MSGAQLVIRQPDSKDLLAGSMVSLKGSEHEQRNETRIEHSSLTVLSQLLAVQW